MMKQRKGKRFSAMIRIVLIPAWSAPDLGRIDDR